MKNLWYLLFMLVKPRNNFPMNKYKKKNRHSTKFGSYRKWFHSIGNGIYTFFSLLFNIFILLISNDFSQISIRHILQYILTLWIFILPYRCRLKIALIFPESRRTVRIRHVAIGYINVDGRTPILRALRKFANVISFV